MDFVHPDIVKFFKSLGQRSYSDIDKLTASGRDDDIPVVDEDVGRFLYVMVMAAKPQKILEIGFGGGVSTLWMAKALSETGIITSLELNTERISRGKAIFAELGLDSRLDLRYVDAFKYLKDCDELYDLVFLDAIKRSYADYLPLITDVIRPGGLLIADNVLFRGNVLRDDVGQKYIAGTESVISFNTQLAASPHFETSFLPIADGLAVAVKLSG
ncbi:MAG: O-methyltransferase [Spirochaetota bacterium]|nr:O-methyltransferase [Spirochaetota bacterium]